MSQLKPMTRHGRVWRLPALLVLMGWSAACWIGQGARAQETAAPIPSVGVIEVARQDVTPSFTYIGRVEAVESVDLIARVEGFLEQRNFQEGSPVRKGDVLFLIEQAPYEIALEQRSAELAGARATLKNAEQDYARKQALVKRKNISQASVDEAEALLGTARASVQLARAAVRRAELDLNYTAVTSPIDGKISLANYSVGTLVGPTNGPLATVTSIDPVYVTIQVTEKDLIDARRRGIDLDNPPVAPSLRLSDGSSYEHPGAFDFLGPTVDATTDTVTARSVFANPDEVLLPGQFVTVIVRQKLPVSSIVVPQAAVQEDQQGHFVLVVDRANKVEVRRVELGDQNGTDWIVTDGLSEGEQVVVRGLQKIRPEMQVNPVVESS